MNRRLIAGAIILACVIPGIASPQDVNRVRFQPGASSASVSGAIQGYRYRDYLVSARSGQRMMVNLKTRNPSTYFNVLPPGSTEQAIFIGSTSGAAYSGQLAQTGDYRVRVYMMRNAARRNERADYTLSIAINGGGGPGPGGGVRPVDITDLKGMDGIRSFDVMMERGFRNVDSITSAGTIYGIYYHPRTRQCIQVTTANGRVVDARDIRTHPKCR